MKIFLDTADTELIKKYFHTGLIDGVTTNPTLIMRSGRDPEDVYQELVDMGIPDISMEVVGDSPEMTVEGRRLFEKFGKLDLFIHSASLAVPMSPIETINEKDLTKYFQTNTFLTQRLIKLLHPLLKIQKDSIAVFLNDSSKKKHKKFLGVYNASQAASKELILSYTEETSRIGPKVLIFEPLPMPTMTRLIMFPGENKKLLSSCKIEANKLIKFIISKKD